MEKEENDQLMPTLLILTNSFESLATRSWDFNSEERRIVAEALPKFRVLLEEIEEKCNMNKNFTK